MNINSWAADVNAVSTVPIQAVTVSSAVNGSSIDTTAYTGTGIFLVDSLAGTSTTLTTNGTFAADSGWTKGTGWSINTGTYTADFAGHSSTSDIKQNQSVTAGIIYTLTYTISNYTAGSITPYLGGTAGTTRAADGTYTELITCGSGSDPKLVFTASSTFRGSIDTVSVIAAKLVVTVEDSADDSSFTTIATGTAVYGIASQVKIPVNLDKARQFVRGVATVTGASGSFTCSVNLLAMKAFR